MAIKYINIISNLRPSKIEPDWDFWFEKKPSGNPDVEVWKEMLCAVIFVPTM
jgi:hypothetical protein